MSQITTGIRSVLNQPFVYRVLQHIMGARNLWRNLADNYLKLEPGMSVLDIGCGPGDILEYLPKGTSYWGYDISEQYIKSAKRRFGSRGNFFCKLLDQSDINQLPKFDRVLLTGVFHHLDDDVANDLITLAHTSLKTGGKIVSVDPCYSQRQNPIARFLISKDRGQNVRSELGYQNLVKSKFSNINSSVVNRIWIPYTHCYIVGVK